MKTNKHLGLPRCISIITEPSLKNVAYQEKNTSRSVSIKHFRYYLTDKYSSVSLEHVLNYLTGVTVHLHLPCNLVQFPSRDSDIHCTVSIFVWNLKQD